MNAIFIISLILEIILSNYISYNSIFIPLFLLTSLVAYYPYTKYNFKKYLKIVFIYGIVYDLINTNYIFLDGILFLNCILVVDYLYKLFPLSKYKLFYLNIFSIILYRIMNYLILVIINVLNMNIKILLNSIISSLIINIFYMIIICLLIKNLYKRKIITKLV